MAASDAPDEAVEAALQAMADGNSPEHWAANPQLVPLGHFARLALAAATPHIRAQVLAEVDAALRDHEAYARWYFDGATTETLQAGPSHMVGVALYLRDTLGAGGDGEG